MRGLGNGLSEDPPGLTRYLTSIISSQLSWIEDEATRERIREAASRRLSERCGRMGWSFNPNPSCPLAAYDYFFQALMAIY